MLTKKVLELSCIIKKLHQSKYNLSAKLLDHTLKELSSQMIRFLMKKDYSSLETVGQI